MRGQRFPSLGLRWIDIFQHGKMSIPRRNHM
ncbi:Uncharacterised protein [Vibrio cholerae]|nr:Uncharacterised protein [Vibrio cholerae]